MKKILLLILLLLTNLYSIKRYSTYSHKAHKLIKSFPKKGCQYLISNKDFNDTYIQYTHANVLYFIKTNFSKNLWTKKEIKVIVDAAITYDLNIVLFLAKIECESSLLTNSINIKRNSVRFKRLMRWILGYGMYATVIKNGIRSKPNRGFKKQIFGGARCLRYWYNKFKRYRYNFVDINLKKYRVYPYNASSYALYKYTPFWGSFSENNMICGGNEVIKRRFIYYKRLWNKTFRHGVEE